MSDKDLMIEFKSELSKVYDGKIDVFHSFSNASEKVRINNCVYLAWEIGGKNNLMESVPRIATLLKENELRLITNQIIAKEILHIASELLNRESIVVIVYTVADYYTVSFQPVYNTYNADDIAFSIDGHESFIKNITEEERKKPLDYFSTRYILPAVTILVHWIKKAA